MARNTILLRGQAREEQVTTTGVITPGMLVDMATGAAHAVDGGQVLPVFAKEQHENQGAGIDDDIASGDEAIVLFPDHLAKINAFTSDTIAAGENVASDGAGGVRLASSGDFVIGEAAAASDLSGTNGRVEIWVASLGAV